MPFYSDHRFNYVSKQLLKKIIGLTVKQIKQNNKETKIFFQILRRFKSASFRTAQCKRHEHTRFFPEIIHFFF